MAKFARPEDKSFSPLNLKLIEEATEPTLPPPEPSKPPAPRQTKDTRTKVVALMTGVENHQPRALESVEALEIETAEDQLTESMRYRVSRVERREIEKFVQRLSDAANVNLTHSNIMRACRDILFQAEDRIVAELEKTQLKRPMNERRALTIFEARLAEILHTAMRQTPLLYERRARG
jgi:hypothetical protein